MEENNVTNVKYCKACGAKMAQEAVICPSCGTAETNDAVEAKSFKDKIKKNKKLVIIGIVAFVVILASVIGILIYRNDNAKMSDSDIIHNALQAYAISYCRAKYADVNTVSVNVTSKTLEESYDDYGYDKYTVYGTITITDTYGDKYKGQFNAPVLIDENDKGGVSYFYLETPRRQ